MSSLDVDVAIHDPRVFDMRLHIHSNIPLISLHLTQFNGVRIALGRAESDWELEAQAMDRLAELATEAAALLRSGGA